jgi:hypothetical protein
MKNLAFCILLFFALIHSLQAQDIEQWIKEKKPLLFEKLYLHVDRDLYAPGDKIWMKAYQVNGLTHELNSNYRNIFVQLVNDNGQVVKDLLLFSEKGQAQGCLAVDSLPGGMYTIRAFTKYLLNFGEEACFHKKIWVSGKDQSIVGVTKNLDEASKIEIAFLPEGGNMVLNAANIVAFKAIDQKGRGVDVSGKIIDDKGDTVTSFQSEYRGMGKLIMMPVEERSYFAVIDQYPQMKVRLENALADGINQRYTDLCEAVRFTMASNMKQNSHRAYYFVASHKGVVLFYKKMEDENYTQTLNLKKSLFPRGISKISLLDAALNVFAERMIFVDDNQPDLVSLHLDKQEFTPRQKINMKAQVSLAPGDSLTSTLSVAVVNKNYLDAEGSSQNIKSYLLLDADLKGPIEMPALFFTDDQLKSAEKLDLLMMVNGWRSYIWDDVAAVDTASVEDWNDAGIEIRGFVKKLLWKAPLADAELTLSSRGGLNMIEKTKSNEKGRFSFKRVYLSNVTRVTINALTKNGTRNAEIRLDKELRTDTIQTVGSMANTCMDVNLNRDFYSTNSFRKRKESDFNPEAGSILLGDVDIRQKRSINDDGHFRLYSNPDKSLTITEDDYNYQDVLDYLEGRVAGLIIRGDEVSIRGGGEPAFLIDGIKVESFNDPGRVIREVRSLRMMDIDKVEVLKSGATLALFGAAGGNGVIAIYRKTMDKIPYSDTHVNGRLETNIKGFHKAPKFYSPSYTPENINDPQPDYRPTLLWEPELGFKESKANIEFYTSDELAHYVVFMEGITKNGKICYGTTSFWVDKK